MPTDITASGTGMFTPDRPLSPLSMAPVHDAGKLADADLEASFPSFDTSNGSELPLDLLDVDTSQWAASNHDKHAYFEFQSQQPLLPLFDSAQFTNTSSVHTNRCLSPLPLPLTSLCSTSSDSNEAEQQQQLSVAQESNNRKQRARLNTACSTCYETKKSCDGQRPCGRCTRLQKTDTCIDRVSLRAKRKPTTVKDEVVDTTELTGTQMTIQAYRTLQSYLTQSTKLTLYTSPSGDISDFAVSSFAYPLMTIMAQTFVQRNSPMSACALIDLMTMTADSLLPVHYQQLVSSIQPRLVAAADHTLQISTEGGYGVDWSTSPLTPLPEDPNALLNFATMVWLNNYSDDVGGRFDRRRQCTVQVNRAFERMFGYEQVEMRHLFMQYGRRAMYRIVRAENLAKIIASRLRDTKFNDQFTPVGVSSSVQISIIDKFGRELQVTCARTVRSREIDGKLYRSWALCFIPFDSLAQAPVMSSTDG